MTLDDAKKIARIVGTADSGCPACVGNLVDQLNDEFPEFAWTQGDSISPNENNDYRSTIMVDVEVVE